MLLHFGSCIGTVMFKDSLSHMIKTPSQRNESKRIQWLRIKILEGKKCLLINLILEKTVN